MKVSQAALLFLSISSLLESPTAAAFISSPAFRSGKIRSSPSREVKKRSCPIIAPLLPGVTILADSRGHPGEEAASPHDATRRSVLLGSTLPLISDPRSRANASQGEESTEQMPLADVPMIRLRLPQSGVGREYVVVQMKVKGQGPFDFMVDSGLTTELITPHLQQVLGIRTGKTMIKGLAAGGDTSGGALVELSDASLCCGKFAEPGAKEFPLPLLHAVVTDFPQEHLDPAHDPVEGMIGMELLALFDVDFDFPAGRLRFWKPGTAARDAREKGLIEIPAAVLNETLLLGMRVTSAQQPPDVQPMLGIMDCGAAFSAVNWAGAELLGLPPKEDRNAYLNSPTILGMGVDGRPQFLPVKDVSFTFRGDSTQDQSGKVRFAQPPKSWRPWGPVKLGIGDLPVFSELLGDGRRPYQGPAALIGLDVLSQRRVIMEAGGAGRRRRLFVSPS